MKTDLIECTTIICTWEVIIKPLINWGINSFINFIENKNEM